MYRYFNSCTSVCMYCVIHVLKCLSAPAFMKMINGGQWALIVSGAERKQ